MERAHSCRALPRFEAEEDMAVPLGAGDGAGDGAETAVDGAVVIKSFGKRGDHHLPALPRAAQLGAGDKACVAL